MKKPEMISVEEFDRRFDDGEDMTPYLDLSSIRRPGLEIRRINVDLPGWIVNSMDLEANRRGVTRQSIIKMWLVDRIEAEEAARAARRAPVPPEPAPTARKKTPAAE
jgi:hypothetical protein